MASAADIFLTIVDYRLQRKAQIRDYLMTQAAAQPQALAQQWRFLQQEQESWMSLQKEIEDIRQGFVRGQLTALEAAKRAEGTFRTAQQQGYNTAATENIRGRWDVEAEKVKARATTIPQALDRMEQEADSGSSGRLQAISDRAGSLASSATEEGLVQALGRAYTDTYAGKDAALSSNPLAQLKLREEAASALRAAVLRTGAAVNPDVVVARIFTETAGIAPSSFSAQARSQARADAQSKIEASLGSGASSMGGGVGSSPAPQVATPEELLGVPRGALPIVAARAAFNKLKLEDPDSVKDVADLEAFVKDTKYQGKIQEMLASPLVELFTYADDRLVSLIGRSDDMSKSIAARRAELLDQQRNLPDIRDIEDQATIAFTDLYGAPGPQQELAKFRAQQEAFRRAAQDETDPERMTALLTPNPLEPLRGKTSELPAADRSGVEFDIRTQDQLRKDARFAPAFGPEAAVPITAESLDAMISKGLAKRIPGTDDYEVDSYESKVRVRPEVDPTLPEAPDAPAPEPLDMGDFSIGIQVPKKTAAPATAPTPDQQDGGGLFDVEPEQDDDGTYGPDEIMRLIPDDKEYDTLDEQARARVDEIALRLAQDYQPTMSIFQRAKMGSEAKAAAGRKLLDMKEAFERTQRKLPKVTAQDVAEQETSRAENVGQRMAAQAVEGVDVKDPAKFLKTKFGRNRLQASEIQLVRELASRPSAPTGAEIPRQLYRIAGGRWVQADVRQQMTALYTAVRETVRATVPTAV